MKDLLVNLIKLLYTLIRYLKTVISFRIAFLISALNYRHCFELSDEDDDIQVVRH